jgi:hypothetical protein
MPHGEKPSHRTISSIAIKSRTNTVSDCFSQRYWRKFEGSKARESLESLHTLLLLSLRICVVEAQKRLSSMVFREAEVDGDGLGVANV